MDLDTITASDFKAFFRRDFPYLPSDSASYCDADKFVLDEDINKAFKEAKILFNQSMFGTDEEIELGYLYLTAHYLCNDLRAAASGIEGTGSFPVSARTVGSVSETYTIPQKYIDSPQLAFYTNTTYGLKYLSLILPNLVGNVGVVAGWTLP